MANSQPPKKKKEPYPASEEVTKLLLCLLRLLQEQSQMLRNIVPVIKDRLRQHPKGKMPIDDAVTTFMEQCLALHRARMTFENLLRHFDRQTISIPSAEQEAYDKELKEIQQCFNELVRRDVNISSSQEIKNVAGLLIQRLIPGILPLLVKMTSGLSSSSRAFYILQDSQELTPNQIDRLQELPGADLPFIPGDCIAARLAWNAFQKLLKDLGPENQEGMKARMFKLVSEKNDFLWITRRARAVLSRWPAVEKALKKAPPKKKKRRSRAW